MDIFGAHLTPTALAFLRGVDQIAMTQDARLGPSGSHLIGYDVLQRYTGVTIAALHNASRQLRKAGLIEARRDLGTRPDSWVLCFELTDVGRELIDKIARSCGIIVERAAVVEALTETLPWVKELRAAEAQCAANRSSVRDTYIAHEVNLGEVAIGAL